MKVIDAAWEKRNMGISCVEINVEREESAQKLESVLATISADYIVVKIPTCKMELSKMLTQKGFCFIETLFSLEKQLGKCSPQGAEGEKGNHMTYCLNLDESKKRVIDEIRMGMYTTDRISIDKHFTTKQTADRYIGMLEDELRRGADLMEYCFDGKPFGFSCFRQAAVERYYQALTGIYSTHRGKGLGFALAYLPECELLRRGAEKLTTGVSTNNEASLKVHLRNGFLPIETTYVYVKHK